MTTNLDAASSRLELLYLHLVAERDAGELLELPEHQLTEAHTTIRELIADGWHGEIYDPDLLALADAYQQMIEDIRDTRFRKLIHLRTVPARATRAEKEFCSALVTARAELDRAYGRAADDSAG
jgi:hypothetical protein